MTTQTLGFIGGGNMARSLAGGLIQNGWPAMQILASDPNTETREALAQTLGITTTADNTEVADKADILVLAVKPQIMTTVAKPLADSIQRRKPLVISIAAGIRTTDLERWLGGADIPLVRAMPNTPALIGSGATGLFATGAVSEAHRNVAESVLRTVGLVVWLKEEAQIDVVTALSGSGPAYFLLVMEALEAAAIKHGLDAATARLLTLETAFGAAKMALEDNEPPAALRSRVTSPGGTTEAALAVLEAGDIHELFDKAIAAARARSVELAEQFGRG